ncbi:MAG: DUF1905 domain-containing protein [Spirochaetota bacterium]
MQKMEFDVCLTKPDQKGTWTYFNLPFSVEEVFGTRGQVKVKGAINNAPYRSSVMPAGDGTHYIRRWSGNSSLK